MQLTVSLVAIAALIVGAVFGEICPTNKPKVVCYYSSWSIYRKELGNFKIEFIDPTLCTHLVYAFAGLNIDQKIDSLDYANDINVNKAYKQITDLKEENPCLKVLIAIGGWNEMSEKYSLLAESEESREKFADSVLRFMAQYNFDGLDFDWEYPAARGGIAEDKQNFVLLLETLKAKFTKRGKLLTAAVGATSKTIATSYDLKGMCNVLDFINVMAYDMHLSDRTSVHAALKLEMRQNSVETIIEIVNNFKTHGCPLEKIILGVPAFGRTYTLQYPSKHDLGAPVKGWGEPGPFTQTAGFLGFNEICDKLYFGSWSTVYLKQNAVKYSYRDNQWMVYDDQETVAAKANYAKANKLGGMMMWSIDSDDFRGGCYDQAYPLLYSINKVLGFPAGGDRKK